MSAHKKRAPLFIHGALLIIQDRTRNFRLLLRRIPIIGEPLRKRLQQRAFLGSSYKSVRSETCERRQLLAVACAKKSTLNKQSALY